MFHAQSKLICPPSVERRMFNYPKSHQPDGPAKRARVVMSVDRCRGRCSMFGLVVVVLLFSFVVHWQLAKMDDIGNMKKTKKLLASSLAVIEEKAEQMRWAIDK